MVLADIGVTGGAEGEISFPMFTIATDAAMTKGQRWASCGLIAKSGVIRSAVMRMPLAMAVRSAKAWMIFGFISKA